MSSQHSRLTAFAAAILIAAASWMPLINVPPANASIAALPVLA